MRTDKPNINRDSERRDEPDVSGESVGKSENLLHKEENALY